MAHPEEGAPRVRGRSIPRRRLGRRGWRLTFAVWIVVYATLAQRLYVDRGPGEAVALANVISIGVALLFLVANRRLLPDIWERFARMPWLLAFLALWAALPLAGVIAGYPIRTLLAATVPLSIGAFALIGLLLGARGEFDARRAASVLGTIVWVQFLVGLMQALWYTGTLELAPQRWLNAWDTAVSAAYGVEQIAGRSVGLYVNPSPYSMLGGIGLVCALTLPLTRRQRFVLGIPSAGILALGASRSVLLALVLISLPWVVSRLRSLDARQRVRVVAGVAGSVVVLNLLLWLTLRPLYERFLVRWATIPSVLAQGASGDANVVGRLEAWSGALAYWITHPFGSFGPPQMAVASFTDNDYVELLLQGGLILLLLYAGTMASTVVRREHSVIRTAVIPLVALVMLTGLTLNSVYMTPTVALFWPVVGSVMVPKRGAEPPASLRRTRSVRAGSRRRAGASRRSAAIVSTLLLLFIVAAGVSRIAGRGFDSAAYEAGGPSGSRPTHEESATAALPGARVSDGARLQAYYVDLPPADQPDLVEDLTSPDVSPEEVQRLKKGWRPPLADLGDGDGLVTPVGVAVGGLRDYTRYSATRDERFHDFSREAADWLVDQQLEDGSWRYEYPLLDLDPGWVSANTQSLALSLLARHYQDSGDDRYLSSAREAYWFAMTPVGEGGVLSSFDNEQPVLEGYPGSQAAKHSLSGAIVGPWGLRDYAVVTDDPEAWDAFGELSASLADHLDDYDIDGWSRYSLGTMNGPAPHLYHRLYISELRAWAELTGDARFAAVASRWDATLEAWLAANE